MNRAPLQTRQPGEPQQTRHLSQLISALARSTAKRITGVRAAATATGKVGSVGGSPTNTVAPSITGRPIVTGTLTGNVGTWTGSPSFTYLWRRANDAAFSSGVTAVGTGTSYVIGAGEALKYFLFTVTATNSSGVASASSSVIGPAGTSVGTRTVRLGVQTESLIEEGIPAVPSSSVAFLLEAAFGYNPTSTGWAWTDLTGHLPRSAKYSRGRQDVRGKPETGQATVVFSDVVSALDPGNTDSPYYPNVLPMVPVRLRVQIGTNVYPLFQHFAERWPRTGRIGNVYTERTLSTVDGFEALARCDLTGQSFAQENSANRVVGILDALPWPPGKTAIGSGASTISASDFTTSEKKALQHLLEVVADTEEGLVFVGSTGALVFIGRHQLLVDPYTTSVATFSDSPGVGEFPYTQITPGGGDAAEVVNDWRGSVSGGTAVSVQDDLSIASFFRRTDSFTSLVVDDVELGRQLGWRISRTKDVHDRVDSITVMPGNDLELWTTVVSLEIGDRITVNETPPGYGSGSSVDYHIQRIDVSLESDYKKSTFTFGLFAADVNDYWLIGVAGRSELGETTKVAW